MYPREKTGRSGYERALDWLRFTGKVHRAYMPEYPEQVFQQNTDVASPLVGNRLLREYDQWSADGRADMQQRREMENMLARISAMQQRAGAVDAENANAALMQDFTGQEREAYLRARHGQLWREHYADERRLPQKFLDIKNMLFTTPGEAVKPFITMEDLVNSRKSR